jgi:DNA-binding IclR family transcriptional regulator
MHIEDAARQAQCSTSPIFKLDCTMTSKRKTGRETSVVRRVSDILNLFSDDRPQIEFKDAEDVLGLSQATAYRYLREMHEAGLLSRVSGRFMPGPKMIELEFIIARYDPLLVAAKAPMKFLSERTGCDVLLGRLYDIRVVNVASVLNSKAAELNFPPGRTVPLFRGSEARVVLAEMDGRTRRRVFDAGCDDPDRDKIGKDWTSFNATLQKNKRDGFYISRGELDHDVTGIAAPVFDEKDAVIGSIVTVFGPGRSLTMSENELVQAVKDSAEQITRMIRS